MKADQIWSEKYDAPVSETFADQRSTPAKGYKIDITKCEIRESYGFYYLYLNGRRLKQITFTEFLKFRHVVKKIIYDWSCE